MQGVIRNTYKHLVYVLNVIIAGTAVLLSTISYCTSDDEADSYAIIQFGFGVADILTDIFLILELYGDPILHSYFAWFLAFQMLSAVFNGASLAYIFKAEQNNVHFRLWHLANSRTFNLVLSLSCFDMQIIQIIYSGVFNLKLTKSKVSADTRRRLYMGACVSLMIENIPQLTLQLLIARKVKKMSEVLLMANILSVFDILQSGIGLCAWMMFSSDDESFRRRFVAEFDYRTGQKISMPTFDEEPRRSHKQSNVLMAQSSGYHSWGSSISWGSEQLLERDRSVSNGERLYRERRMSLPERAE